jgi:hypothetical protein
VLGCVIALAGGAVSYVANDTGSIELLTDNQEVQILLLQNDQEIEILDSASKKTWSVRSGKYTVRPEGRSHRPGNL